MPLSVVNTKSAQALAGGGQRPSPSRTFDADGRLSGHHGISHQLHEQLVARERRGHGGRHARAVRHRLRHRLRMSRCGRLCDGSRGRCIARQPLTSHVVSPRWCRLVDRATRCPPPTSSAVSPASLSSSLCHCSCVTHPNTPVPPADPTSR